MLVRPFALAGQLVVGRAAALRPFSAIKNRTRHATPHLLVCRIRFIADLPRAMHTSKTDPFGRELGQRSVSSNHEASAISAAFPTHAQYGTRPLSSSSSSGSPPSPPNSPLTATQPAEYPGQIRHDVKGSTSGSTADVPAEYPGQIRYDKEAPKTYMVNGILDWHMPRYPDTSPVGILRGADYVGTVAFAFTGAITAASVGMDLLGCMTLGTITAVGGGTIRDAIVLHKRPFWADGEHEYLYMALAAAIAAFFLWPTLVSMGCTEDDFWIWALDTVGIGAFCIIGAKNGIRLSMHPLVSLVCGILTATGGGVVRDTLAQRPPRILYSHSEIYATTAGCGAGAFMLGRQIGMPVGMRLSLGFWTAVVMRYVAWRGEIGLPTWEKIGAEHLLVRRRDLKPLGTKP